MKDMILEAMYKTIQDSLVWGIGEEDYGHFVDGVMAMTETMLELENKKMLNKFKEHYNEREFIITHDTTSEEDTIPSE